MSDSGSTNSDTSLCSSKNTNCYRNLEYEEKEAPIDDSTSTFGSGTISVKRDIKDDSLFSTEITSDTVNPTRWKNDCHSKYCSENEGQKINGNTNLENNVQFMENLSHESSHFSANQILLDETKDQTSYIVPTLVADNTRRRQMSSYEKMMALTCQKCGQK
uniref:Zinc finger protein n=1 Tax=Loa loa TaxID=7209 RepID=A0A1I7VJR7_LOALO